MATPSRLDEPQRLSAVAESQLLDSPVDERFDRLTRVAAQVLDVPFTAITLLDGRRQFFLSAHGAPEPVAGARELPLEHCVCRHVVETGEPLLIADARDHELVADNPVLQAFGIVAYAGVPLVSTGGQVLGTVCAFDLEPRAWSALDVDKLRNIAQSAMAEGELRQATARARDTEARHAAVIRAALDCIIVMDERGLVAEFNPAAEKTFGYPREAALGRPLTELILPADRPAARAALAGGLADGDARPSGHREEMVARRADGSELPVELTVTRTDLHGRPLFIANVRDLSEVHQARREREDARRRSRTLVGQITAAAPVGLVAVDLQGTVTFARGRVLKELGLLDSRLAGVTVYDVEAGLPGVVGGFERARGGERASTRLDVARRVLDVSWQPVLDASGAVEAVSAVAVDVTERTRGEERVAHLAYHDHVTGLPNRRKLAEALDQAHAAARGTTGSGLALLWLDIDAFKAVNDGLGHAAGDELLREIAVRLAGVADDGGLLARHGGDEFVVLLEGCGADAQARAETVAGRLLDALGRPIVIHGTELEIGGSVGIAVCHDGTTAADDLLARADAAMYSAKHAGGHSYALWSPDDADPYGRLTLPARLRRAIAEDRLVLHYQPIVSARTGATPAFEALVRWRDTDGTLIPPGVFIAAAETSGVIVELGAWVADAVCAQLRQWRDAGLHAAVSINASPRELAREDFAPRLAETIERHGVEPLQLMVEVTESALMGQPERVDCVLAALRDLGVRIGIDDFGADHSSLNRLRSLPVEALKIDRAFLQDVPEDPRATALVRAIVGLGQALGMAVVAEGVERAVQQEVLREAGCDFFQGFYFSRPVPASEATALLRTACTVSASTPSSVRSAAARASSAGG